MRIKHLREWLECLPTDYDETEIVFRTIKENKEDTENWYALDIPIAACGIDDGNNEMYFCDEKSTKIIES
jgi:hypothetical protein